MKNVVVVIFNERNKSLFSFHFFNRVRKNSNFRRQFNYYISRLPRMVNVQNSCLKHFLVSQKWVWSKFEQVWSNFNERTGRYEWLTLSCIFNLCFFFLLTVDCSSFPWFLWNWKFTENQSDDFSNSLNSSRWINILENRDASGRSSRIDKAEFTFIIQNFLPSISHCVRLCPTTLQKGMKHINIFSFLHSDIVKRHFTL